MPMEITDAFSNNYIQCKSNDDKNKILSIEKYLEEIEPYLKDIIYDLQKSGIWKIK